nr:hypothetical protein [Pandoravirus massiliensis]
MWKPAQTRATCFFMRAQCVVHAHRRRHDHLSVSGLLSLPNDLLKTQSAFHLVLKIAFPILSCFVPFAGDHLVFFVQSFTSFVSDLFFHSIRKLKEKRCQNNLV